MNKQLDEIIMPAVNIPERIVPVVDEDMLPSFIEMGEMWKTVVSAESIKKQNEVFYTYVAEHIKDNLAFEGYDITPIEDNTNFYIQLSFKDKPMPFKDAMEAVFP